MESSFSPLGCSFHQDLDTFPSCPWQPAETGLSKQIQKISFNGRFCSSVHRNKTQLPQSNLILGWTCDSRCHCGCLPGHCLLAHNQLVTYQKISQKQSVSGIVIARCVSGHEGDSVWAGAHWQCLSWPVWESARPSPSRQRMWRLKAVICSQ